LPHLRSSKGYDEPKILLSSIRPICPTGADVRHRIYVLLRLGRLLLWSVRTGRILLLTGRFLLPGAAMVA
jgi:hypothetical protein